MNKTSIAIIEIMVPTKAVTEPRKIPVLGRNAAMHR